jgi:hypothetical protein
MHPEDPEQQLEAIFFSPQKLAFFILIGFSTLVVQLWYIFKQTIAKQNKVSLLR